MLISLISNANFKTTVRKPDISSFFQAAVVSILLYGCTTWTLIKRLEKKLVGNYTRMLRAVLKKSWRQHPTRHQLYGHLPPITKTIQVRRTRHAGHCWRSKDELISDVLLWTPTYGRAKAGRPARTYIQQLCEDTGCNPEDLLEAMNDREKWRERVRDIRAGGTTWWWWWYIRGAFNKFPDFFVQAFKIVVDPWKFTMLLLYILWDDWPIFMISASNKRIGIHPTKPWLSQLVNFKNAIWMSGHFRRTICNKILF